MHGPTCVCWANLTPFSLKRDRTIWPGDMGVSVATLFATVGLTAPSENALTTLYKYQGSDGMMPYVGPPIAGAGHTGGGSDTYHMWSLIGNRLD